MNYAQDYLTSSKNHWTTKQHGRDSFRTKKGELSQR